MQLVSSCPPWALSETPPWRMHITLHSTPRPTLLPHSLCSSKCPPPTHRLPCASRASLKNCCNIEKKAGAVLGKPKPYISLKRRVAFTSCWKLRYYFSLTRRSNNGFKIWAIFPRMDPVPTRVILPLLFSGAGQSSLWNICKVINRRHFSHGYWFEMVQTPAGHQPEYYNWQRGRTGHRHCCGLEKC